MALVGDFLRGLVPGARLIPKGTGFNVSKGIVETGQKLKLPELGISEKFGGYMPKAYAAETTSTNTTSNQPVGSSTDQFGPLAQQYSTSTGGGGGGGAVLGSSTGSVPLENAGGSPDLGQYDGIFNQALAGLDEAVAPLQANAAAQETSAKNWGSIQGQNLDQNIAAQSATLDRGGVQQQQQGETNVNEARRQLAEINQGLQARYGGTTGTGAFASEIAGSQALRSIGDVRQQVSNAMQVISEKKQQVQEIGRIAKLDIEQKTQDQINQIKANLDNSLADIRNQKANLLGNKAQLAAQAIQIYQKQVADINARNASVLQQIYFNQKDAEQKLALAHQSAKQTADSFKISDYSNLVNQVSPVGGQINVSGKVGKDSQSIYNPTITISPDKQKDELTNPFATN